MTLLSVSVPLKLTIRVTMHKIKITCYTYFCVDCNTILISKKKFVKKTI